MPPQIPNNITWHVERVTCTDEGDEISPVLQQMCDDDYTILTVTSSPQRNLFRVVGYKQATP